MRSAPRFFLPPARVCLEPKRVYVCATAPVITGPSCHRFGVEQLAPQLASSATCGPLRVRYGNLRGSVFEFKASNSNFRSSLDKSCLIKCAYVFPKTTAFARFRPRFSHGSTPCFGAPYTCFGRRVHLPQSLLPVATLRRFDKNGYLQQFNMKHDNILVPTTSNNIDSNLYNI